MRSPRFSKTESCEERSVALRRELAAFNAALRDVSSPGLRQEEGRLPNREEVMKAAWSNLAIEEPDLTLEEVRRLSRGRR